MEEMLAHKGCLEAQNVEIMAVMPFIG